MTWLFISVTISLGCPPISDDGGVRTPNLEMGKLKPPEVDSCPQGAGLAVMGLYSSCRAFASYPDSKAYLPTREYPTRMNLNM